MMRIQGVLLLMFAVSSCGGGGGGGSSGTSSGLPSDGLSNTGHVAGTVVIASNGTKGQASVTLDDLGRALAVWIDGSGSGPLFWNQATTANVWGSATALLQAGMGDGQVLRTTPSGSASALLVADGSQQKLLRYSPTIGWDPSASPVPLSNTRASFTTRHYSDFVLLSDADQTIALSMLSNASAPIGAQNASVHVLTHGTSAGWSTFLETDPFEYGVTHLTANSSGAATLFWMGAAQTMSGFVTTLHSQVVDLLSGSQLGVASFLSDGYRFPCVAPKQLTAARSQTTRHVIALTNGFGSTCNLDLIQVDTFAGTTIPQRMNPVGTTIDTYQPIIAMSPAGDTLAVWAESPAGGNGPATVKWSQSLAGGPWSVPAVLVPGGGIGQSILGLYNFSLAMNANGQVAVAATALVNTNNAYLTVARFSFSSGWSNWQIIADTLSTTTPDVAINAQGAAIVVYGATRCDRIGLNSFTNCGRDEMYAFRF